MTGDEGAPRDEGDAESINYWLAELRAYLSKRVGGGYEAEAVNGRLEIDAADDDREQRAEAIRRLEQGGFTVESDTSEETIRVAADPTRLAATYRDVETVDASEIEEGESVRVHDQQGLRLEGTVTGIETEAGRYGVTIRDPHGDELTAWQQAGRTFQRLEGVDR